MNATISGDIVASTALNESELLRLGEEVTTLFKTLSDRYNKNTVGFWGRMIKGDYIECYLENPKNSLRVALLIKTVVKRMLLENKPNNALLKKRELYRKYGVRLAIGIGEMRTVDLKREILDGEAIYLSGRRIDDQKSSNKEKVVIKNTMYFETVEKNIQDQCSVLIELLDFILNKATAKQCNVLHYKLLGESEMQIAKRMGINQAAVNQHSTAVGWNVIEHALNYYETPMTF